MTDKRRNIEKELSSCCEGMPFAEMMQKMMSQRGEHPDFDCGKIMQQMMAKQGGYHDLDCGEMMQKMVARCCGPLDDSNES